MAINKVVYGDETLVDMTDATATAEDLLEGTTAYGADGKKIEGLAKGITVDDALSDTSTNPVQNKVVHAAMEGKLDKLAYEWNKAYNAGSSGYLYIGSFTMYDSNVTVEISSTTSTTYSGKLVIATQNAGANGSNAAGFQFTAKVYGDSDNALTSRIKIKPCSYTDGVMEVYFQPPGYSKNIIHIMATGLRTVDESTIAVKVDTLPDTATTVPTNVLTSNFLGKSATASDSDKLDGNDSTYYLNYENLSNKPTIPDAVTDVHINELIDAKLGVIENGAY